MSSRLFRVLFQWKCTSTHHKLAMEALQLLSLPDAEAWKTLFLKHHEQYLLGSKAPDKKFRDFRNHVLHVGENFWGGACAAAKKWYDRLVVTLREQDWEKAVYVAGVLSHYCTDPWMPLHTGQSEEESAMHRACEWSVAKSYDQLRERITTWPQTQLEASTDWLEEYIKLAAMMAHEQYDFCVSEYDLDAGVKSPPDGLTEPLREVIAELLSECAAGWSAVLTRAFQESGVQPPNVSVKLQSFLVNLEIPIRWVTNKIADAHDRRFVLDIYEEFQETGKVEEMLPADEKVIRQAWRDRNGWEEPQETAEPEGGNSNEPAKQMDPLFAEEPNTLPMPGSTRDPRFYLEQTLPVEKAPSIGAKTAKRLESVGIATVADLLEQDPEHTAEVLSVRYITPDVLRDWQAQAKLVCRIPGLRGHDAQFLVECGIEDPETLCSTDPEALLDLIVDLLETPDGKRILRDGRPPDLDEVKGWINAAGESRDLEAA